MAWAVIQACRWQLRLAPMGGPVGLDFGAVAQVAQAMTGGLSPLLAQVLPEVEAVLIAALRTEGEAGA